MNNEATFIIRSASERTEQLCKKLILEQGVDSKNIFIVREVPFSATLKKTFEIGIDQNLTWTFCVDADVLLRSGSIETMLTYAEQQKKNVCEIQSLILDKFFGGARDGGVHLYRTSLLKAAIKCIPKEGVDIRPETRTLEEMKKRGFPWVKKPYVVGTHDDEQYFYDIYRKSFVHGIKHTKYLDLFITHWKERSKTDKDFEIALQAMSDSILNVDDIFIDKNQDIYKEGFKKLKIAEKEDINFDNYSIDRIDKIIQEWVYPEIYYEYYPTSAGQKSKIKALLQLLKKSKSKKRFKQTYLYVLKKLNYKLLNG